MKMSLKMPDIEYIPGTCNIGKGEVRKRQLVALVGLFFSVTTLLAFSTVETPTAGRLGIFFPLMVASVGFVQSRSKFCLAYGFAGTFNVGKMGDIKRVSSKEDRAADRRTALVILGKSFLLAALATAVVLVLPF
jgi:UDP-N-acetylmuramyl pentapeptide phosphotransferase/UDP-N-acetylglucosamine-1-phosphate transferase